MTHKERRDDQTKFYHLCRPKHVAKMETNSSEWFNACNKAFVDAMRKHHPEREVKRAGKDR